MTLHFSYDLVAWLCVAGIGLLLVLSVYVAVLTWKAWRRRD